MPVPRLIPTQPDVGKVAGQTARINYIAGYIENTQNRNALAAMKEGRLAGQGERDRKVEDIDTEIKVLTLGKDYLKRVSDIADYGPYRQYMMENYGVNDAVLPAPGVFESEEAFDAWRDKATMTAGELIKARESEKEGWSTPREGQLESGELVFYQTKKGDDSTGMKILEGVRPITKGSELGRVKTIQEGNELVTYQFYRDGSKEEIGRGPKFKPGQEKGVTDSEKFLSQKRGRAKSSIFKLYNMNDFSSVDETTSEKAGMAIEMASQMLAEDPKLSPEKAANQAKKKVDGMFKTLEAIPGREKPGVFGKGNRAKTVTTVRSSLRAGVDTKAILEKLMEKGWTKEEGIEVIRNAAK